MKKKNVLENGLSVIFDKNSGVSTVTYAIYFAVGSLYENKRIQGISHFIEHMFFRRLNNIPQKDLYYKMESMAGTINGSTSIQYVCFDFTVVSEYASSAFNLIKEVFSDFNWTEAELTAEKKVICREIDFRGSSMDFFDFCQTGSSNYSKPIKGTIESIEQLTIEEINAWKKKFFSCNNACFIATGSFTKEQEEYFVSELSKIKPLNDKKIQKKKFSPTRAFFRSDKDAAFPDINGDTADISIVFDVDLSKNDCIESQIVYDAFCCGNGSKLSYVLKDTYGFIDDMYSEILTINHYGRICISWSVIDSKLFESLDIFCETLKEFKNGITEDEYISSIGFSTVNAIKYRDDTSGLAKQYGYFDFICEMPFSIEESVNRKKTLTTGRINEVINSVFVPSNMFVYVASNRKHIRKKDLVSYFQKIRNSIVNQGTVPRPDKS